MQPGQSEAYRVIEGGTFGSDWRDGIAAGWINLMVHPAQVEYFTRSVLATTPYVGRQAPGEPANYRTIRFPHTPRRPGDIEIIYSIVEDDRTVILEKIRLTP